MLAHCAIGVTQWIHNRCPLTISPVRFPRVGGAFALPDHGRATMDTLTLILLILAALAFAGATLGLSIRVNLVALGLFYLTLTQLIPRL